MRCRPTHLRAATLYRLQLVHGRERTKPPNLERKPGHFGLRASRLIFPSQSPTGRAAIGSRLLSMREAIYLDHGAVYVVREVNPFLLDPGGVRLDLLNCCRRDVVRAGKTPLLKLRNRLMLGANVTALQIKRVEV